jgi:hypothetical protein
MKFEIIVIFFSLLRFNHDVKYVSPGSMSIKVGAFHAPVYIEQSDVYNYQKEQRFNLPMSKSRFILRP